MRWCRGWGSACSSWRCPGLARKPVHGRWCPRRSRYWQLFGVGIAVGRRGLRLAPGTGRSVAGAGVLDITANLLYLLGTRAGFVSIVAALTSLYPATTVLLARGVLKERMSWRQLAGLVVALAGIVLISVG
jgi:drug/metabolite transporter (DMT)-like permease